jgi:hypothetical protein
MVIAALVLLLFLADLLLNLIGQKALAPFYGAVWYFDLVFVIAAGVLGFLSWLTFKEQV